MDNRKGFGPQRGGVDRGKGNRGRRGRPDNKPWLELVPIPRTRGNPFGFDTVPSDRRVPLAHDHPLNLELASMRHELDLRNIYWTGREQDIAEEMANPGSYDFQMRRTEMQEYDDKINDILQQIELAELGIVPAEPPVTISFRSPGRSQQSGAESSYGRSAMNPVQRRQDKNQNRKRNHKEQSVVLRSGPERETSNLYPTRHSSQPISARQSLSTIVERPGRGILWTPDAQAAAVDKFHRQMQSDGRGGSPEPEPPRAYSPLFFGSDDDSPPPFSPVESGSAAGSDHGDIGMSRLAEASGPIGSLVLRPEGQVESRHPTTLREQEEALLEVLFLEAEAEREQQRNDEAAFHEAAFHEAAFHEAAFHEAEAVREEERLKLSALVIDQIASDIGTHPRPDSYMQAVAADSTTEDIVQVHAPLRSVPTDTPSRVTGGRFRTIEEVEEAVQMPLPVRPVLASSRGIFTVDLLERDDSDEEVVQMPSPVRPVLASSRSIFNVEFLERDESDEEVVQMPSPVRPVHASSRSTFDMGFLERDDSDEEVVQMPASIRLPPAGSQSIRAEERSERVREIPLIQASIHPTSDKHLPSFLRNMEQYAQQREEDELLAEDPDLFHSLMRCLSNSPEAGLSDEDAVINQASDLPTPGPPMDLAAPEPAPHVEVPVVHPRVLFVSSLMRATAVAALKAAEAEMRKAAASEEREAASMQEDHSSTNAGLQKRKLKRFQEVPAIPEEAETRKAAASEEKEAASTQEVHPSTSAGLQKRKLKSFQEVPAIPEEGSETEIKARYKLRPRSERAYRMEEADPETEHDTSTDAGPELESYYSKIRGNKRLASNSTSSSEAPVLTRQHSNLRRRAAVTGSLVARYVEDDQVSSAPAHDRQVAPVQTQPRNSTTQPSLSLATQHAWQGSKRKPSRSLFIRHLDNAFEVGDHFPDQDTINMVDIRRELDGNHVVRFNTHENAKSALDRQPPEHKRAQRAIRPGQRRLPYVKWYDEREDAGFPEDSDDGSGDFGAVQTSGQRGASWRSPDYVPEGSSRSARPQPGYPQQAPERSYFDTEAAAPAHPTAQGNTAEAALPSPDPQDHQLIAAVARTSNAEGIRRVEIAGEVEQMMEIVNAPLKTLLKRDRIAHLNLVNEELKLIVKDKERKRQGVVLTVTEQKRVNREQDFLHYRRDVLNSLGLKEE